MNLSFYCLHASFSYTFAAAYQQHGCSQHTLCLPVQQLFTSATHPNPPCMYTTPAPAPSKHRHHAATNFFAAWMSIASAGPVFFSEGRAMHACAPQRRTLAPDASPMHLCFLHAPRRPSCSSRSVSACRGASVGSASSRRCEQVCLQLACTHACPAARLRTEGRTSAHA